MNKLTDFEEKVYLAIKYINDIKGENIYPKYKTITSFVKGNENSPFINIYRRYPNVCGSFPNVDKNQVLSVLNSLRRKNIIEMKNDCYFVLKTCEINNSKNNIGLTEKDLKEIEDLLS